ncbi:UNVERIFIED_CONTAM: hypothetical protein GTU68_005148 [Idotea baltica]|nr:hypothetical protein [Idotea baltica]
MAVLNRAYSGETGGVSTPFEFQLAGINRVRRPEWAKIAPASELEVDMKMELHQGGADTLNIYLTAIDGGELGEVLGVATLPVFYPVVPFYDGVTINFRTLPAGPLEFFNVGHVLVHEVGHWLGLLHTFQGQCDGIVDDLVEDTPREQIPGSGDFCPVGRDSCPDRPGIDPINNHMTYTEDTCRFEFTAEQVQFMRFNATVFRGLAG